MEDVMLTWRTLRRLVDDVETIKLLEELRRMSKISEPEKIIRLGARFLYRAYRQLEQNGTIVAHDEDGIPETVFRFPRDGEPDIDEIDRDFGPGEEGSSSFDYDSAETEIAHPLTPEKAGYRGTVLPFRTKPRKGS